MGERIRLTFLGRIDAGKGIDEAIRIFEALRDSPKYECCIYGIRCERESQSRVIHEQLAKQRMIKYVAVDRNRYSLETEQFVRDVLADTDVFIQPYQRLSSTIDTPLLLLESMASLCAVLTKPYGNIPDIYGESDFLLSPVNFVQSAVGLLQNTLVENIQREHLRVFAQIQKYSFNSSVVAKQYLAAINL
ncbi:MAG: hypothetical protein A2X35_08020 [Elusimicrobia bacterium GWA2_61_42]|nr:MAG: hypothetical protein A2X35_08020 [Elusimicrobia bacterium GWA2_61_42]OGR76036.1 MAG: hypothetical protein A2X38_08325 [Elusimicrobia bacterium GWC2_61_25]